MQPRNVLVISYYWPPSGGPGVQRVLKFCKYLPEFGWNPIVLTVQNGEYPARDPALSGEIHPGTKVYKARSLEPFGIFKRFSGQSTLPTFQLSASDSESRGTRVGRWIRYNLVVPDARVGWYRQAVRVGSEILRRHRVDVIFSSGPPHSLHFIARRLAGCRIPWVADFRDPWTERFYYLENPRWEFTARVDAYLERMILRASAANTAVSQGVGELLQHKSPRGKIKVIYNGFDPADFHQSVKPKQDGVNIGYVGTMTKSQLPVPLLKAVRDLNRRAIPIRIHFAGNVHPTVRAEIADTYGLSRQVYYRGYVSHTEAIRQMQAADLLLLVVPDTPHNQGIVTGKLFEYMHTRNPVILIGPETSEPAEIVRSAQAGYVVGYHDEAAVKKILEAPLRVTEGNIDRFSRVRQAEELAHLFSELV